MLPVDLIDLLQAFRFQQQVEAGERGGSAGDGIGCVGMSVEKCFQQIFFHKCFIHFWQSRQ